MISVQELTKEYGLVKAVDNISFEIQKGEILGFLGPERSRKNHHNEDPDRLRDAYIRQRQGQGYAGFEPSDGNQAVDRLHAAEFSIV